MSLKEWVDNGWLKPHRTSAEEIANLRGIVKRDLADAQVKGVSTDARFNSAYNAALKLCTIVLFASGYRAGAYRAHYYTIETLPLILGSETRVDADYLEACLTLRNQSEYDFAGGVDETAVEELRKFAVEFEVKILAWMKANHPALI